MINWIIVIMIIVVFVWIVLFLLTDNVHLARRGKKKKEILKYKDLTYETTEDELLDIMGDDYTKRIKEGGVTEYEWTWNNETIITDYRPYIWLIFILPRKVQYKDFGVIVRVLNGKVIEVNPYNM